MYSKTFLKFSMIFSTLAAFLGSILIIDRFKVEPSMGLFLFFLSTLVLNIVLIKKSFPASRFNIISIGIIISYIFIDLGFILNTKNHAINALVLLFFAILLNINLISSKFNEEILSRYFYAMPFYFLSKTVEPFRYIAEFFKALSTSKVTSKNIRSRLKRFLIVGSIFVLIGFPIIFVVLPLLASTNEFYANWLNSIFSFNVGLDVWIFRAFFIFFVLPYILSDYLFTKLIEDNKEKLEKFAINFDAELNKNVGLALVLVTTILNFFYILFVFAESKYDFGNLRELVILKNLDSFSELAVGRFWELLIITIINTLIVYFGRKYFMSLSKNSILNLFLKANVILFFVNTFFLIFSAYQRLNLYITTYGFTHKRFEALTFLPVILLISALIFATLYVKNHTKLYSLAIAIFLTYFGFMTMIPSTFVINELNYSLRDKIEVLDPLYTVNSYGYVDTSSGDFIPGNDVNDFDGLLTANRYVDGEGTTLNRNELRLIIQEFNFFKSTTVNSDWREFNVMKEVIKRSMEGKAYIPVY